MNINIELFAVRWSAGNVCILHGCNRRLICTHTHTHTAHIHTLINIVFLYMTRIMTYNINICSCCCCCCCWCSFSKSLIKCPCSKAMSSEHLSYIQTQTQIQETIKHAYEHTSSYNNICTDGMRFLPVFLPWPVAIKQSRTLWQKNNNKNPQTYTWISLLSLWTHTNALTAIALVLYLYSHTRTRVHMFV